MPPPKPETRPSLGKFLTAEELSDDLRERNGIVITVDRLRELCDRAESGPGSVRPIGRDRPGRGGGWCASGCDRQFDAVVFRSASLSSTCLAQVDAGLPAALAASSIAARSLSVNRIRNVRSLLR